MPLPFSCGVLYTDVLEGYFGLLLAGCCRGWRSVEKTRLGPIPVSVHSRDVESFEDFRSPIDGAEIEVTQLGCGRLSGRLTRITAGNAAFSTGTFSVAVRSCGTFNDSYLTLGVLLDAAEDVTYLGHPIVRGDFVLTPPGGEFELHYAGAASFGGLAIRPQDMTALFRGEPALADLAFWSTQAHFHSAAQASTVARSRILRLGTLLSKQPEPLTDAAIEFWKKSVIESFGAGILASLPAARDLPIPSTLRVVREARHYADRHTHRPIHVSELCAALNVSRRTLHRAFHDVTGMGPVAFLRQRRLSAAYSRLRRASPSTDRVTQIALEFGFTEFGRFAARYRSLYGESPSQTLYAGKLAHPSPG